ncbi:MAG: DUF262 domain-containing protein [Fimbriimonadaceae bacterium]|nr:DUF262 domain-containing protein [Fimbriimonadaceae bacterium]
MSIEARNRTLPDWFTKVRNGSLALPRFQRHEAWTDENVAQAFNTVLQELPIGAMLVLEIGDHEPFVSRPIKGGPDTSDRVAEHLLDGQQRLTALWRGLHNNYSHRTYFLELIDDPEEKLPYRVKSIARWQNPGDEEPRPFWANRTAELWKRRLIPLDLFAPGEEAAQSLQRWLKEAVPSADEREEIHLLLGKVRLTIATYNVPYLSLPANTEKETALNVFIKMNTSAEPLSIYDIVVAQLEASMESSLHEMVADIREACPAIEAYYSIEDLSLYAHALLQGKAPIQSSYMQREFGPIMRANWASFLRGVKRTVQFLEEERIFDKERIPSEIVVPVLVRLWATAPERGDAEGVARSLMRKYIWRAFFTNRYERATNSRALVDASELAALIGGCDTPVTVFDEAEHPLPEVGELLVAGWPKRKDRTARGILAVALRSGGYDLADGSHVTRENLKRREYHHVFPDAMLQRNGVEDSMIQRSLNCALVTWSTNRTISDKDPERYLTERRDRSVHGEAEIRRRLESHLISFDDMVAGDYRMFLANRAERIHASIVKLCNGEAIA